MSLAGLNGEANTMAVGRQRELRPEQEPYRYKHEVAAPP